MEVEIKILEGVSAELNGHILKVKGEKGEVERNFRNPIISLELKGDNIILKGKGEAKRAKRMVNTNLSHIQNMMNGVKHGFKYKLQGLQRHFPMRLSVNGDKLVIENFLGEKKKRTAKILPGVKVKVNGLEIEIESCNLEKAGQTAANIVLSTKIKGRDRRKFVDGVFITEKAVLLNE